MNSEAAALKRLTSNGLTSALQTYMHLSLPVSVANGKIVSPSSVDAASLAKHLMTLSLDLHLLRQTHQNIEE